MLTVLSCELLEGRALEEEPVGEKEWRGSSQAGKKIAKKKAANKSKARSKSHE